MIVMLLLVLVLIDREGGNVRNIFVVVQPFGFVLILINSLCLNNVVDSGCSRLRKVAGVLIART